MARCPPLVGDECGQLQLGPKAGKGLGKTALERAGAVQDLNPGDVEPVAGALRTEITDLRRNDGERLRVAVATSSATTEEGPGCGHDVLGLAGSEAV